jgi:FKBP-type peptidyl-prolyl cis-trans isomerase
MFFSCEKDKLSGTEEEQIEAYIAKNNLVVTEKTTSGLRYIKTMSNASGTQVTKGKTVNLNYTGKLLTDKKFDSGNFSFESGMGQVIKGFDEGIAKTKIGEKATLIFPSSLGYGARASGSIPANSPLRFDIEVLSVK